MLWIKAFHIIALVTWFSGLFYLPRLFVYHAQASDEISQQRFKLMEWRLFYYITTPGGITALIFGIWLLSLNFHAYLQMGWMHTKLMLVFFLILYHIYCGRILLLFKQDKNEKSERFYRWFNEIPSIILIAIVILSVVKPF